MSSPILTRSRYRSAGPGTAKPARLNPIRSVVPPQLQITDTPAAAVLRAAAANGPIARDTVARTTGLSIATVNRQVSVLLAAGLLRERADLTASGAIGRPRVPFEVDHSSYVTIGVHIGAVVTKIVAADLRGRILGGQEIATPQTGRTQALAAIANSTRAFTERWHKRRPLWVGVALAGRVDSIAGTVDHPRLGWQEAPVGAILGQALGVPVSVAAHVEAMAAAELLLSADRGEPDAVPAGSLFFYARETAGVALALAGRVHTPSGGPGSIAHLPTGSSIECSCGRTGCLEATVSDRALTERGRELGLIPADGTIAELYRTAEAGSQEAHELLVDRSTTLGRTVAVLRDLFNPDRVILGGQAFTAYQAGIPHVAEAFAQTTTLPRKDIRLSGFGPRVQEYAAAVTSLSVLYADPLTAVRRSLG